MPLRRATTQARGTTRCGTTFFGTRLPRDRSRLHRTPRGNRPSSITFRTTYTERLLAPRTNNEIGQPSREAQPQPQPPRPHGYQRSIHRSYLAVLGVVLKAVERSTQLHQRVCTFI
ncbi:unnamed protein product, partial [Ectocarpus fasciculatus]